MNRIQRALAELKLLCRYCTQTNNITLMAVMTPQLIEAIEKSSNVADHLELAVISTYSVLYDVLSTQLNKQSEYAKSIKKTGSAAEYHKSVIETQLKALYDIMNGTEFANSLPRSNYGED